MNKRDVDVEFHELEARGEVERDPNKEPLRSRRHHAAMPVAEHQGVIASAPARGRLFDPIRTWLEKKGWIAKREVLIEQEKYFDQIERTARQINRLQPDNFGKIIAADNARIDADLTVAQKEREAALEGHEDMAFEQQRARRLAEETHEADFAQQTLRKETYRRQLKTLRGDELGHYRAKKQTESDKRAIDEEFRRKAYVQRVTQQYTTKRALEEAQAEFRAELEKKLARGEISPEEYQHQKENLNDEFEQYKQRL